MSQSEKLKLTIKEPNFEIKKSPMAKRVIYFKRIKRETSGIGDNLSWDLTGKRSRGKIRFLPD